MLTDGQPEWPVVSMVVPSFRYGRFLRQALESLIGQTYPHLEIIVRDNLSDDETAPLLEEFADRVTVVREHDRGQADAIKKGFQQARGSILGWLNADDLLMPGAVAAAVRALSGPTGPDLVYGHCALLVEDGAFLGYFDSIRSFCADELRNYMDFIPQSSTFFRREAYERAGGIDPNLYYAMDWDLWCRFAKAGFRFEFVNDVLSGARIHPKTKSATGGSRRLAEIARVNVRHTTRLVPMVPLLHAASFCYEWAGHCLGPLRGPVRRAWRWVLRRSTEEPKAVVNGLAFPRRVVSPAFRIRFPVYRILDRVRLVVEGAGNGRPEERVMARLNGRPSDLNSPVTPGCHVLEWRVDPGQAVSDVDIEGLVVTGPPTGISVSVELISAACSSREPLQLTTAM